MWEIKRNDKTMCCSTLDYCGLNSTEIKSALNANYKFYKDGKLVTKTALLKELDNVKSKSRKRV